jgi:hypothetical protein
MKKISKVLYRFRLMTSILALVLLLGALVVTPASADEFFVLEGESCENGCIGWNQEQGCVTCQRCCVKDSGEWRCWQVAASSCS